MYERAYVRSDGARWCTERYCQAIIQKGPTSSPWYPDVAMGSWCYPVSQKILHLVILMYRNSLTVSEALRSQRTSVELGIMRRWGVTLGKQEKFLHISERCSSRKVWLIPWGWRASPGSQNWVKWIFESVTLNLCQERKQNSKQMFLFYSLKCFGF